ncbi:MAG: type I restriction enzyme HsdR N-terminal domain-containing protein [Bacteroidales bacterium]|nr:type I restriction enzyme HsdR N-terminal domain-containing protein [Bacteroidales bacterium]
MSTDKLFDPLRHKEVAATAEERVRQWFISVLLGECAVPSHLMMSEAPLQFGAKKWRADILIYDRSGKALAVVECKRPDVDIDSSVAAQALRYNLVLDVRWLMLTNGVKTLIFRRDGNAFRAFGSLPKYEQMLCQP